MISVSDKVVVTRKEFEALEKKADDVYDYNDSMTMDVRKRMPYYKPTVKDFMKHNLPVADVLPYYIYLTRKDKDGEYRFEPDDAALNKTRSALYNLYNDRIIIVETDEEAEATAIMIKDADKKGRKG